MSVSAKEYFMRGLQEMESLDGGTDWAYEEGDQGVRNFVSSGDINMFDMCPTKVYYAKIQEQGFDMDIGFHYNKTMKRMLTTIMREKKETKKLLKTDEALELPYSDDDSSRSIKDYWENYKDAGNWMEEPSKKDLDKYTALLSKVGDLYVNNFAAEVKPSLVEHKIHLPVPGGGKYNLFMNDFIDLMDESGVIYLYKYPGKTPSMDKVTLDYKVAGSQWQTLIAYTALVTNFEVPEHGHATEMVYMVSTKNPKIVRQPVTIYQKHVDALVKKTLTQWEIIAKGLYTTNRGCSFCKDGKGGCSYYIDCHTEF